MNKVAHFLHAQSMFSATSECRYSELEIGIIRRLCRIRNLNCTERLYAMFKADLVEPCRDGNALASECSRFDKLNIYVDKKFWLVRDMYVTIAKTRQNQSDRFVHRLATTLLINGQSSPKPPPLG